LPPPLGFQQRGKISHTITRALIAALAASNPSITLKQASRAIGRNDVYLQQFLHRGTSHCLPEDLRHQLAAILDIDQSRLAGNNSIIGASPQQSGEFAVPFFDLLASAGGGSQIDLASEMAQNPDNQWVFSHQWLAKLGRRQTATLRMISTSDDWMVSLLDHYDTVMLDCSQTRPSPPGTFILDDGVGPVAKRIETIPNTTPQLLRISPKNAAFSNYQRRIDEIHIIGRVLCFARRL